MYETECPYCEKNVKLEIDLEGDYNFDYECPYCEKEFEVEVEFEPTFSASEIVYEKCDKCGEEVRKIHKRRYCYPYPENDNYNKLCYDCYNEGIMKIDWSKKSEECV